MYKCFKKSLWLVVLLLSVRPIYAQNIETRLQAIVNDVPVKTVPGIMVLVDSPTISTLHLRGVADRKTETLLQEEHLIRAGSIGKTYVAALIAMAEQEGLLRIDDAIDTYLTANVMAQLPVLKTPTIRHLLNHTSGIPDFVTARFYLTWKKTAPPTIEQVFRAIKNKRARNFPGQEYSYSNTNFYVLALLLEKVYEEPLHSLLTEKIFKPLGLERTYYNEYRPPGDDIHGYGSELRKWKDTYEWRENHGPDGGVKMTASDLAKWMRALFSTEGQLAEVGTFMVEQSFRYDERKQQGLGVEILESRQGTLVYGHTGGLWGYLSAAYYVPKTDTVLVLYMNRGDLTVFQSVLSDLLRIVTME